MRIINRTLGLSLATVTLGMVAVVGVASATPTTEQSGSIIIFPKVLGTTERDTLIEISNSSNLTAHAHCYYINSAVEGQWTETDFDIWLTKQQPTHWLASSGRRFNLSDDFGSDGSGFDPGLVPPVPSGFQGELRCVQVDDGGAPQRANSLKGNATLIREDGDVSKYNAIALLGNPDVNVGNSDGTLELNHTESHAGEYDACPDTLILNTFADGVDDPIIDEFGNCGGAGCPITTELTLVPCAADYERAVPSSSIVNIEVFNEFEQPFSATIEVVCWLNIQLSDTQFQGAFDSGVLGTLAAQARLNPARGDGAVIGVAEELHTDSLGQSANAAFNLHIEGNRYDAATDIRGNLLVGRTCAGGVNEGDTCSGDGECPGSACINGVADQIVLPEID